jgi:NAD(P)-dependent dehydrogenase (short-subunit alcohol dehydrogenase family)
VLVLDAGVSVVARLLDTPTTDFDRLMAVNLRAPFLYARAAHAELARRRGSMIHIASDAGLRGEQAIALRSAVSVSRRRSQRSCTSSAWSRSSPA